SGESTTHSRRLGSRTRRGRNRRRVGACRDCRPCCGYYSPRSKRLRSEVGDGKLGLLPPRLWTGAGECAGVFGIQSIRGGDLRLAPLPNQEPHRTDLESPTVPPPIPIPELVPTAESEPVVTAVPAFE